MELRVLRYFLAVAREGTILRAAEALHITQPTLSRQLQELEAELGQALFVRGRRQVELTPEGLLLLKRAEEICDLVGKTEAEFNAMGASVGGKVYIGGGETPAMRSIIRVMAEARRRCPAVRYHMFSGNAADVMERLDKGTLDFGVLIQPVDVSRYDGFSLPVGNRWGVVLRRDNPLAKKVTLTPEDLLGVPVLVSRVGEGQPAAGRNPFEAWFGERFNELNVVATYNLIYNAALMVEAGLGCALALEGLVEFSENSALCFRPFLPNLDSGLNVVWKKGQRFSRAAETFLKLLREAFSGDVLPPGAP